jgi:hypothetical protein
MESELFDEEMALNLRTIENNVKCRSFNNLLWQELATSIEACFKQWFGNYTKGGSSYQPLINQPTKGGTPIHTKTSILVHHNMLILMIHAKNAMHVSLD